MSTINTAKLSQSLRLGYSWCPTYEECEANLRYLRSKEEFDIYEIARCLNCSSTYLRNKFKKYGLVGERKPRKGKMLATFYSKETVKKLIESDEDLKKRVEIMKGDPNKKEDKFKEYKILKYKNSDFKFGSGKNHPAYMEAFFEYLGQKFYVCAHENIFKYNSDVKIAPVDNCDFWPEDADSLNYISKFNTNHTLFLNTRPLQDIIENFIKTLEFGVEMYKKKYDITNVFVTMNTKVSIFNKEESK